VILYAIAIDPMQAISMELSAECAKAVETAAYEILQELNTVAARA